MKFDVLALKPHFELPAGLQAAETNFNGFSRFLDDKLVFSMTNSLLDVV